MLSNEWISRLQEACPSCPHPLPMTRPSCFQLPSSWHNTLCASPLSCRSSASGVPGSWRGGPGLSCDTITYYKAQKNSGKLWMGGKQALSDYEALSVEINSQTFWARAGERNSGTQSLIHFMKKPRRLPIPLYPRKAFRVTRPSSKNIWSGKLPPRPPLLSFSVLASPSSSWRCCRPSFPYLLHLLTRLSLQSSPAVQILPCCLGQNPRVSSGFAQTSLEVAWGMPAKRLLLTHRPAGIWPDVSHSAPDSGFLSSMALAAVSPLVFLSIPRKGKDAREHREKRLGVICGRWGSPGRQTENGTYLE